MLDLALEQPVESTAKRAGALRTDLVRERTTLLVVRVRHLIHESAAGEPEAAPMLAEEVVLAAYRGEPAAPDWLPDEEVERLLSDARPVANVMLAQAASWLQAARAAVEGELQPHLAELARHRAEGVLDAHRRVRQASHQRGLRLRVAPHLPLDVLGLYVLMPPPVGVGGR